MPQNISSHPELIDYVKPLGDLRSFENEWMEVEVLGPRSPLTGATAGAIDISGASTPVTDETGVPAFLCDNIDPSYMHLECDNDCEYIGPKCLLAIAGDNYFQA